MEFEDELEYLRNKVEELTDLLQEKKDFIAANISPKILEFYNKYGNIRLTSLQFNISVKDLFEFIPEWEGCPDGLINADDYKECMREVYGRQDEYDLYNYAKRELFLRTPDKTELEKILKDYNDSTNPDLYFIADYYNLWINNLFRLLKENNVINVETEAKGYNLVFILHQGTELVSKWDGKQSLNLIEDFYKKQKENKKKRK
jgi:hypothetical protein